MICGFIWVCLHNCFLFLFYCTQKLGERLSCFRKTTLCQYTQNNCVLHPFIYSLICMVCCILKCCHLKICGYGEWGRRSEGFGSGTKILSQVGITKTWKADGFIGVWLYMSLIRQLWLTAIHLPHIEEVSLGHCRGAKVTIILDLQSMVPVTNAWRKPQILHI